MDILPVAAQQEQVSKFLYANKMLGAEMDRQQGTTRVIFDLNPVAIGQTTINFFDQVSSKAWPDTNLEENRFQPGEGMVIKEILIFDPEFNIAFDRSNLSFSLLNFYIGNQRVIKNLPLTVGSNILSINPLNSTNYLNEPVPTGFRLLTNIVIPPQVQFYADVRLVAALAGTTSLKMMVKGYGKLFNPNQNY